MPTRILWLALAFALLWCPQPRTAAAHRVSLFAYVASGQVYTESYFPDGQPVVQGRILVMDTAGNLLLSAKTDAAGLYHFQRPSPEELVIRLEAAMGHQATFRLPAGEPGR